MIRHGDVEYRKTLPVKEQLPSSACWLNSRPLKSVHENADADDSDLFHDIHGDALVNAKTTLRVDVD